MPQIRVRDRVPELRRGRGVVWGCLADLGINVQKINEARGAFYIICNDATAERLVSAEVVSKFVTKDLDIQTPPEHNSNRTVILKQIDDRIVHKSREEVKDELERCNSWAEVEEVIFLPNINHLIKVRFTKAEMSNTCAQHGVLLFNQSIIPKNVEKEIFIRLFPCFKCYSFDHTTAKCTKPNTVICSECASTDHTFRECNSETKKCINCSENHRTLAAKCPIRKKIIKEREKLERDRRKTNQQQTYAGALRGGRPPVSAPSTSNVRGVDPINPLVEMFELRNSEPTDLMARIMICLTYSHQIETVHPGTFQETMNKMLTLNSLPMVTFPDTIPRMNLITNKTNFPMDGATSGPTSGLPQPAPKSYVGASDMSENEMETESDSSATTVASTGTIKRPREKHSPHSRNISKKIKESSASSDRGSMPPPAPPPSPAKPKRVDPRKQKRKEHLTTDQVGISIICCETYKQPAPEFFNREEIRRDLVLQQKKMKYQYTNSNFDPDTVQKAVLDGIIKLKDAKVYILNTYAYEQIISGTLKPPTKS